MDEPGTNLELFPKKDEFRIVALSDRDVRTGSDDLRNFKELVLESEPMYPGIGHWLSEKVLPTLGSTRRLALLAYESGRPAVSAVLKTGERSKFCHLRVKNEIHRDRHLGELFFSLMALSCRKASEIHFTLPESLWGEQKGFFSSFGFSTAVRASSQYRKGEFELACSAPASAVVQRVLEKAPRLSESFKFLGKDLRTQLLMSIQPRFAQAILTGDKRIEIRRRFSEKWVGARVTLYAVKPEASLVGEITISDVVKGEPGQIWQTFGRLMGCSIEEFQDYVGDAPNVSAISFEQPRPYANPIPLAQLSHWMDDAPVPPQSYRTVDSDDPWGKALTLASLLQGRFATVVNSQAERRRVPAP